MDIHRSLHFSNNEEHINNPDRFYKLGSFMRDLLDNFSHAINPGEFLTLDESLLGFKGRLAFKQFNRLKRARFGIKIFILADSATKFLFGMIPYQGKTTAINAELVKRLGFGGAAVMQMLEAYFEKNHRMVVDNWFLSPTLAEELLRRKTFVLGTVQKRRQGMPKGGRMSSKLNKGQIEVFSNGRILLER
jgi:hypothetical protein